MLPISSTGAYPLVAAASGSSVIATDRRRLKTGVSARNLPIFRACHFLVGSRKAFSDRSLQLYLNNKGGVAGSLVVRKRA
jgi:hypothetical protein